ncbi:MAG: membrane protein insertase YidC [Bdellovibrionaceae bacterium]|nr:membrane protein insertase YidC [Pseudobdellovibrionaceae bacterium]
MQEQNSNPFNSRFLIAMVVFALFYFGWNQHLQKKYPGYGKKTETTTAAAGESAKTDVATTPSQSAGNVTSTSKEQLSGNSIDAKMVTKQEEKVFSFDDEKVSFVVSSRGLGIRNVEIKNYEDKDKQKIKLGVSDALNLFEMKLSDGTDVYFDVQELGRGKYKGIFSTAEYRIERDLVFNETSNSFKSTTKLVSLNEKTAPAVKFYIPEKIMDVHSSSWLFPSYQHQDFYTVHENTSSNLNFSSASHDVSGEYKGVNLVSIGSQYFATAIIDESDTIPEAKLSSSFQNKTAQAELIYRVNDGIKEMSLQQTLFAGPKSIDMMNSTHPELAQVINFGWLSFIAKPLLFTMKWFFSQIPNWGIAIILLTLLVRLFVLPFNLMSYKSMKAMQKIQPMMTAVREKFKDDPVRMNQEVMNLMKENKANPFGGCLPMLLQIPIFFALYRVIGSSIELYGSPFMWWITDLSAHDKFFVLPILMGITMFVQQKLTPTNMDPMQAKILLYMPLIFTIFMVNLPSGLTLYMFISALFGAVQQYFMMKTKPA